MDLHRDTYGVEPICKVLQMAPSCYWRHAARKSNPQLRSDRAKRDEQLMADVQRVWHANWQVYGADKIWLQMNREGIRVARCTIERLMRKAGLQGVRRGKSVRTTITTAPDVDVISFTGSNLTGQRIMAAAAPTMKKLSLELGGKSCCLVFEDADIDHIAPQLAAAATVISGQQCTAARRVLVHASRYEAMKKSLAGALASIHVAPGNTPGAQMGPLIDPGTAERVQHRIEQAMEAADEVILRGERLTGALQRGGFISPTLVAHRDTSASFVQEEIFGPLVVLEKFETENEAVARANHTEFGLSASVWTEQGSRAWRIARALRNGTVWINDHNKLYAEAETGGYRRSGLGRLHVLNHNQN